ncbi:hypothetical protein EON67_05750 [archaeon]|nr:MAG: hypothetical protein EON67_05750 [archaeon]
MRTGNTHPLAKAYAEAGYLVEPAAEDPARKSVITFPVDVGDNVRTLETVSMWEQFEMAAFLQRHWADNQVSCTVTFDPEKEVADIPRALTAFEHKLKVGAPQRSAPACACMRAVGVACTCTALLASRCIAGCVPLAPRAQGCLPPAAV